MIFPLREKIVFLLTKRKAVEVVQQGRNGDQQLLPLKDSLGPIRTAGDNFYAIL